MRLFRRLIVIILTFSFCLFPLVAASDATELREIQQRGYLTVAVKDNIYPLGFRDAEGKLQGLEIDLAKRLAKDLLGDSQAVKLRAVNNRDRMAEVLDNRVDIAIARFTATASRARLVNFSIPYYLDGTVLVTKNTSVDDFGDLKKLKVGVLKGSSTISYIEYFIPSAELVGVDSYLTAQQSLEENKIDAFAADATVLSGWVRQYPQYRLLETRLSTEPLCVIIPKGLKHDPLRRKIDQAIALYLEQGWLQERIKFWGLPPSSILES
ncbi:transporter substrate-binding domain-containing protein [Calothrix sp. PCC 6303]|uniref:transporter substrate-binding domain-containing protein n=1 Tax=Calothrix sp. PCC 6303 TaxID=1170562 RepID=UPI0002A036B3|nr:transporter substrate-binding domain-containing protein [Calothrix sp. PCC 6303]AFY99213.1 amino acid ABC transporter substrate-binding protein, PAAT family [Calothrix sp. PCC 6303]